MSPRVRMALRLYSTMQVPTMQEAAKAVGLNNTYLATVANKSPVAGKYMDNIAALMDNEAEDIGKIIQRYGRAALNKIAHVMVDPSAGTAMQLKAAIDLADRSPETAATQKHQLEAFSIGSDDAKLLAAAMVNGRAAQEKFGALTAGNFDKVEEVKNVDK